MEKFFTKNIRKKFYKILFFENPENPERRTKSGEIFKNQEGLAESGKFRTLKIPLRNLFFKFIQKKFFLKNYISGFFQGSEFSGFGPTLLIFENFSGFRPSFRISGFSKIKFFIKFFPYIFSKKTYITKKILDKKFFRNKKIQKIFYLIVN